MLKGKFTTAETAKEVGIHLATLQRWIATKKIKAPKPTLLGAVGYRLWSKAEVASLKNTRQSIYRKGRGRKPKGRS
jgi:excisionase family DNA binding protein